jgi:hypothetical protein
MVFIELPLFRKYVKFSDDELREIQSTLIDNPKAGDVIRGGGGLRKLRVALPGRGKRGGARVIDVYVDAQARCYLVTDEGNHRCRWMTLCLPTCRRAWTT